MENNYKTNRDIKEKIKKENIITNLMLNMFNYRRDRNSEMVTSIPVQDREIYLNFFDKIFK